MPKCENCDSRRKVCSKCYGKLSLFSNSWGSNAENTWYGNHFDAEYCKTYYPNDDFTNSTFSEDISTSAKQKCDYYKLEDIWRSTSVDELIDKRKICPFCATNKSKVKSARK